MAWLADRRDRLLGGRLQPIASRGSRGSPRTSASPVKRRIRLPGRAYVNRVATDHPDLAA